MATSTRSCCWLVVCLLAVPAVLRGQPAGLEAAAAAEAEGRLNEAFLLYLQALRSLPGTRGGGEDWRLHERIVGLAARLQPPPLVPETAIRFLTRGLVLFKDATDTEGFERAAAELRQAVDAAPWHAPGLYNLALVQEKLRDHQSALLNLRLYLLTGPEPEKARAVRAKVYELELRVEQTVGRRRQAAAQRSDEEVAGLIDPGLYWEPVPAEPGIPAGCDAARVSEVAAWGAAKAGLRPGDLVYRVDGSCAIADFDRITMGHRAGDPIRLHVMRGGQTLELTVAALELLAPVREECISSGGRACRWLALAYLSGQGVQRDLPRAAALLDIACGDDDQRGCALLAEAHLGGYGINRDASRAAALADGACTAGEVQGCYVLGRLVANGDGVALDRARALTLMDQACRQSFGRACYSLAVLTSERPTLDAARSSAAGLRAAQLAQPRCRAGDMFACEQWASLLGRGLGVPQDYERAAALNETTCQAGWLVSCNNLANQLWFGRGVPKDKARAAALFTKACDGGDIFSCKQLGIMIRDGEGVPKDKRKAAELFQRACDGGDQDACKAVRMLR